MATASPSFCLSSCYRPPGGPFNQGPGSHDSSFSTHTNTHTYTHTHTHTREIQYTSVFVEPIKHFLIPPCFSEAFSVFGTFRSDGFRFSWLARLYAEGVGGTIKRHLAKGRKQVIGIAKTRGDSFCRIMVITKELSHIFLLNQNLCFQNLTKVAWIGFFKMKLKLC